MRYVSYLLFLGFLFLFPNANAQNEPYSSSYIKQQIEVFKADQRGPYKDLRWFCTDGSVRMPKDPCPAAIAPGRQHARYKDVVESIGGRNHIFFGQILAYTTPEELWDDKNLNSRLKQYQLGKYLYGVDDGWVLRKGQYYRGAFQEEDEEAAGIDFYEWILTKNQVVSEKYYLIRESLKDVPHSGDNNLAQSIRSQSKAISDADNRFMKTRVKIHGQPDASDIQRVENYQNKYKSSLSSSETEKLNKLIATMRSYYKPVDGSKLMNDTKYLSNNSLGSSISSYTQNTDFTSAEATTKASAELLYTIRTKLVEEKNPRARLEILDLSLRLEEFIFKKSREWNPKTLESLMSKIYHLGLANTGAGYVELWEWNEMKNTLNPSSYKNITLGELMYYLQTAQGQVEWCASMVKAYYQDIVNSYGEFEPMAYGFIDDRIRGSIMLPLGDAVGELGAYIAKEAKLNNKVMDFKNTTSIRGLNPGYAFGELVVVEENPEDVDVSSDKIYIFQRPPSGLKPVAGIATVEEGNMVSHVQLLARNLGIPNSAMGQADLQALKKFNGKKIFYAVSNKGTVIMKLSDDMTLVEKELFEGQKDEKKEKRGDEKIAVPIDKLRLDLNRVMNMREVDASSSGNLCGPKAANLGQLKKIFPNHVVEGLVIPFGIFRDHMDMTMPGKNTSYWGFLTDMFKEADSMREKGSAESMVETFQLGKLAELRKAIMKMPLRDKFKNQMKEEYKKAYGEAFGKIPVFLRSDTNMEDLKEFTGAGLNLTLFNVAGEQAIFDGIKEVWASPYTERSFKWRQKYLSNPENVFPSILVIPGVNVEHSGVMITKGIRSGIDNDLTVAMSRGAGGAVDGQIAETYLIRMDQTYDLIAPSRESKYNYLPKTGGVDKRETAFNERILDSNGIKTICEMAEMIRKRMPKAWDGNYDGAYDVELGFKDGKLWLFQIRPFVENKKALSSDYLESITPKSNTNRKIPLNTNI